MSENGNGTKRSVRAWRGTSELTLPSGLTVTVKRPPLALWIAEGKVPEGLFGSAMAMAVTGGRAAAVPEDFDFKESARFALKVAEAALAWPKVVEQADPESDDEIELGDLSLDDAMAIMMWAIGGKAQVQTVSGPMSEGALARFPQDGELQGDSVGREDVRAASGD